MKAKQKIVSVDAIMNAKFGKVGSSKRNAFREEAKAFCVDYSSFNDISPALQKRAKLVDNYLNVGYQNVIRTAILLGLKELEMKVAV